MRPVCGVIMRLVRNNRGRAHSTAKNPLLFGDSLMSSTFTADDLVSVYVCVCVCVAGK